MSQQYPHDIIYPTVEEILSIHRDIVEEDEGATAGVRNKGQVEYTLVTISEGHFGRVPETIHEKAAVLLRLLAANHPFVDGNKRTALNTTWTFYAMNGLYFDYGEEIKAILKLFAVMEEMVDFERVVEYFEEITYDSSNDRVPSSVIEAVHLSRWYLHIDDRIQDTYKIVEEHVEIEDGEVIGDPPEELFEKIDFEDLIDILDEYLNLTQNLIEYKAEYEEELSDESLEWIDEILDEWSSVRSALIEQIEEDDPDLDKNASNRLIEEGILDEEDIDL